MAEEVKKAEGTKLKLKGPKVLYKDPGTVVRELQPTEEESSKKLSIDAEIKAPIEPRVESEDAPPKPEVKPATKLTGMQLRWNAWVEAMMHAERIWKEHVEGLGSRVEIENLPVKLQAHLAQPFTKGTFGNALEELPRYILSLGGMNELYVKGDK